MSQDYIAVARRLRAQEERRRLIRRRELIILGLFGVCTLFFAIIG
jgi:hypothetical protein